jgi:thiol-disulfide isomerase/thioredoxin
MMRALSPLLLLALLVVPTSSSGSAVGPAVAAGDIAPGIAGKTLDGWNFRAQWDQNALTIVNFWATWCEPCRVEMPALQELHAKYAKARLEIVGVLIDAAGDDEVRKFVAEMGAQYRILRGDSDITNAWGGIGYLPTTFVVNAKGRVLKRYVGATPERVAKLKEDVDKLMGALPPPAKP